jgi:uncharacterized membrane protein YeiB
MHSKRIDGYDLARAPAIFGMVIVNLKTVMHASSSEYVFSASPREDAPLSVAVGSALLFCVAAIIFSYFWMSRFKLGTLEWLMRKATFSA